MAGWVRLAGGAVRWRFGAIWPFLQVFFFGLENKEFFDVKWLHLDMFSTARGLIFSLFMSSIHSVSQNDETSSVKLQSRSV